MVYASSTPPVLRRLTMGNAIRAIRYYGAARGVRGRGGIVLGEGSYPPLAPPLFSTNPLNPKRQYAKGVLVGVEVVVGGVEGSMAAPSTRCRR
jgi:hypothetical protein